MLKLILQIIDLLANSSNNKGPRGNHFHGQKKDWYGNPSNRDWYGNSKGDIYGNAKKDWYGNKK